MSNTTKNMLEIRLEFLTNRLKRVKATKQSDMPSVENGVATAEEARREFAATRQPSLIADILTKDKKFVSVEKRNRYFTKVLNKARAEREQRQINSL